MLKKKLLQKFIIRTAIFSSGHSQSAELPSFTSRKWSTEEPSSRPSWSCIYIYKDEVCSPFLFFNVFCLWMSGGDVWRILFYSASRATGVAHVSIYECIHILPSLDGDYPEKWRTFRKAFIFQLYGQLERMWAREDQCSQCFELDGSFLRDNRTWLNLYDMPDIFQISKTWGMAEWRKRRRVWVFPSQFRDNSPFEVDVIMEWAGRSDVKAKSYYLLQRFVFFSLYSFITSLDKTYSGLSAWCSVTGGKYTVIKVPILLFPVTRHKGIERALPGYSKHSRLYGIRTFRDEKNKHEIVTFPRRMLPRFSPKNSNTRGDIIRLRIGEKAELFARHSLKKGFQLRDERQEGFGRSCTKKKYGIITCVVNRRWLCLLCKLTKIASLSERTMCWIAMKVFQWWKLKAAVAVDDVTSRNFASDGSFSLVFDVDLDEVAASEWADG